MNQMGILIVITLNSLDIVSLAHTAHKTLAHINVL